VFVCFIFAVVLRVLTSCGNSPQVGKLWRMCGKLHVVRLLQWNE